MALPRKITSSTTLFSASAITGVASAWYIYSRFNALPPTQDIGFKSKSTFPSSGFVPLTLLSTKTISPNVKQLTFSLPKGDTDSGLPLISSLLTKTYPSSSSSILPTLPTLRPYTPIPTPNSPTHLTFLIKHYPNGAASSTLHSLLPGQTLQVRAPPSFTREFDYAPNKYSQLTLVAGGAGVTPFLQLLSRVLLDPNDGTVVRLVYAGSRREDLLWGDEIRAWERRWPGRFEAVFVVGEERGGVGANGEGGGEVVEGRITKEVLSRVLPLGDGRGRESKVLVCGPPGMVEAVAGRKGWLGTQGTLGGLLEELGVDRGGVVKF